jgi:hypothetical protein
MDLQLRLVALFGSLALLLGVLELVRRRRLLERYALVWLAAAGLLVLLTAWSGLLGLVAGSIGISYPPSALFVIAFVFVILLLLHFSVAVSRLADQSKVLAQRVAMLEERLRRQETAASESSSGESALEIERMTQEVS